MKKGLKNSIAFLGHESFEGRYTLQFWGRSSEVHFINCSKVRYIFYVFFHFASQTTFFVVFHKFTHPGWSYPTIPDLAKIERSDLNFAKKHGKIWNVLKIVKNGSTTSPTTFSWRYGSVFFDPELIIFDIILGHLGSKISVKNDPFLGFFKTVAKSEGIKHLNIDILLDRFWAENLTLGRVNLGQI